MKKKAMLLLNFIAIVLILVCTYALSYAWYVNSDNVNLPLEGGSAGGYFRGGSGTALDPYEIANSRHMYNFAWLQNNGKYVDSNGNQTKMYFELVNADGNNGIINMDSIIIPPVGNDEYPFLGEFNGNGCVISNLIVSTDYNVISNGSVLQSEGYKFSNAVGLFGMTGEDSSIKNFILDDPTVDVFGIDSNYSTSSAKVAGLAIGHVEKHASSIGVKGGALSVNRGSYTTVNSIVGAIKEGIGSDITGGAASGSGSGADTGHFIPDHIFSKVTEGTKKFGTISSDKLTLTNNMWLVSNKNDSDLELGSFSLVTASECYIETDNEVLSTFRYYKASEDYSSMSTSPYNKCKTSVVYTDAGGYIDIDLNQTYAQGSEEQAIKEKVVNFGGGQKTSFSKYLYCKNSPESLPNTATVIDEHDQYIDASGNISSTAVTSDYNIMNNCVKVNIVTSNAKIFVIAQNRSTSKGENNNRYVGIYKLCDTAGTTNQFISNGGSLSEAGYVKAEPYQGIELFSANTGNSNVIASGLYACEFKVSEPGVYSIASTNSGINFFYLAVEGVEEGDTSSGLANSTVGLSAIDFIYDDVLIYQNDDLNETVGNQNVNLQYNFVDSTTNKFYVKSDTAILFTLSDIQIDIVLYFRREKNGNGTVAFNVKYYGVKPSASKPEMVTITGGAADLVVTSTGVTSSNPFV